jgi:hypothetical protein
VADFSQRAWSGSNYITNDVSVTLGEIKLGRTAANWAKLYLVSASPDVTITLDNSSGTSTVRVSNLNYGATINTTLAGTDNLVIVASASSGYAALELGGTNTYSGNTYLTSASGVVRVNRSSTGSPGAPTSGPFGTGTLYMDEGSRLGASSDSTIGNPVVINGDVTIGVAQANSDIVLSGPVTLTDNCKITQGGLGSYGYEKTRFAGPIGEDAPGRILTLRANIAAEDYNGDRQIYI